LVLSAASLACIAVIGGIYEYQRKNLTFVTETGEQRFMKLSDGSTVELNSQSRVRIRFSGHDRNVDLIAGQALFHVSKDATRPFIVHSGSIQVRAVGTEFDVYRTDSGTVVTVVEGRVAVLSPLLEHDGGSDAPVAGSQAPLGATLPPQAQSRKAQSNRAMGEHGAPAALPTPSVPSEDRAAVFLDAGQQLTVGAAAPAEPTHADTAAATAWTQRELVFVSTPLTEVAREFNRYNTRQLTIEDSALGHINITGVFSSTDSTSLLKFLRAQPDIAVRESKEDIRITKK